MRRTGRVVAMAIGMAVPFVADVARAQESLDQGKTPAQLFASDCAICHRSPRGLSEGGGLFGLQSFLRAHYTASIQSAAALAAYLEAVDREAPPRARSTRRPPKHPPAPKARPKPTDEQKAGEESAQPAAAKDSAKPDADKPATEKPAERQPAESTPVDSGPSEAKTSASDRESKPEVKPEPESKSAPEPEDAGSTTPKAEAEDSVPDIIKPEKTN